jgi:HEAT repeat protein
MPLKLRMMLLGGAARPGKTASARLMTLSENPKEPLELREQSVLSLCLARPEAAPGVNAFLLELIKTGNEPPLVAAALWCFYENQDAASLNFIMGRLHDPDLTVRQRAIVALANQAFHMPDRMDREFRVLPSLMEVLGDPDPLIVNTGVQALAFLEPSLAVPKMEGLLDQNRIQDPADKEGIRWNIAQVLGAMKDVQSERVLLRTLDDPDDAVAAHAAEAVYKRNLRDALPRLRERLARIKSEDIYSRAKIQNVILAFEKKR